MDNRFAYTDETDKSFGLTGMVISLNVCEADSVLDFISLDAPQGESIGFAHEFFFNSNPRLSAKIAWRELINQYKLLTTMMVGNILCRQCVHRRQPVTNALIRDMRSLIADDGRDVCSLDEDEIDNLYRRTVSDMVKVYQNVRVHDIAMRFASRLVERRRLSRAEAMELLQSLL